jgi:hypothetical protein
VAHAQVAIPGTNFTLTPVNNGTGGLVSVPIPGGSGLSVTVGTGSAALPLQEIKNNANAVNISTSDDGWNNVPLGFDFPFYGRVFNNSWAMTNGVVTFQDPMQSGAGGLCCAGVDLRTTTDSRYNYSIYGLHTDLYSWNGQNQYYLREGNSMTYGWYGVSQCCSSSGGNSFEIKINSAGLVDTRIAGAMIQYNMVTSGMAGDLSKGEYFQAYHGQGINIIPGGPDIMSWQALSGTGAVDMCIINPLSSTSCPGYQTAYTTQQCTISALWDPSCPGYQTAYFTQQCSLNALYNSSCPGYETAYFNQQCTTNPLYSTRCSGYATAYHDQQCSINALYATDCPGYAAAYLDQQCSINPLYSTTCRGYAAAYHDQQCSINPLYSTTCRGYAAAYHDQQCSINPLFATTCTGYAAAYHNQQCTANPLYSTTCTGYAEAYKAQQCSLDGLYDRTCPNYSTAYATKMVLEQQGTASIVATAGTVARNDPANQPVSTTTVSTTVGSDGAVAVGVSKTGDSNVDKAIAPPPPSATSATAAAGAVQLAPPPPAAQQQMAQNEPKGGGDRQEPRGGNKQEERKDDAPKGSGGNSPSQNTNTAQASSDKPAAPTARQALQERREAAAKAEAVEKGKNLAGEMGKASDLEAQKAVQNVVIQAMGFTPGFDAYSKQLIVQQQFYKPYQVYGNQKNIDNRANLRMFGGTDSLHQQMIESQYNKGN